MPSTNEKKLAALGFELKHPVKDPVWKDWDGTLDPIGRKSINGECRGIYISGVPTKKELYARAIEEAEEHKHLLTECTDPDCEFHNPSE